MINRGFDHIGEGHNPYFNRWFSAISEKWLLALPVVEVTILILIDGFLQYTLYKIVMTTIK